MDDLIRSDSLSHTESRRILLTLLKHVFDPKAITKHPRRLAPMVTPILRTCAGLEDSTDNANVPGECPV